MYVVHFTLYMRIYYTLYIYECTLYIYECMNSYLIYIYIISTHPLIVWEPTQGKDNRGRRRLNYVDVLKNDTGILEKEVIITSMLDRDIWRELTHTDARVDDQDHPRN